MHVSGVCFVDVLVMSFLLKLKGTLKMEAAGSFQSLIREDCIKFDSSTATKFCIKSKISG
jgi:hypothetical protein